MKKIISLSLIILAFVNCKDSNENKKPSNNEETQSILKKETSSLEIGCYTYNDGKSIVNFEITDTENQITGNLTYQLYEKDSNKVNFKGTLSGDKLLRKYHKYLIL